MCSSILIVCFPVVVRRFFLIVSIVECLHNELSRDIPANVVLKSNVPNEVL